MAAIPKEPQFPVTVWEAPVRIWHWVMVLAMLVLFVTGYFIGTPPPSVPGEASENFLFGYIRFAHFSAGYIFAVTLLGRIYWAFVGNKYAREIFVIPVSMLSGEWWKRFFAVVSHYLFIKHNPEEHVGHNPLAAAAMFFMYVVGSVFMIVTGFSMYGEGLGMGSWAFTYFTSWVNPLLGYSQAVHTWHHACMWYLIAFAIVHVYFVLREDIWSGLTVVGSMLDGVRARKK